MKDVQVGASKIFIPDIINGLTSERAKVKKAFRRVKPDLVAIQASEEELSGLKKVVDGEEPEYFMSNYEEIYARRLAEFGEVKIPPPCYETALKLCLEKETPICAIDMDDLYYADIYVECISSWDLYRHSFRVRRMRRKRFKAETPEDFVLEWDREINKLKGFRNLESKREDYMARELARLAKDNERILCILEMQRSDGVYKRLLSLKDVKSDEGQ